MIAPRAKLFVVFLKNGVPFRGGERIVHPLFDKTTTLQGTGSNYKSNRYTNAPRVVKHLPACRWTFRNVSFLVLKHARIPAGKYERVAFL